jgi:nitroreductase
MKNSVLEAIKERRSVVRFNDTPVEEEKLEAILEAGRWAPSWLNKQPWKFIVITDTTTKEKLSELVPTILVQGLKEAPVCIAVAVDTTVDPYHFIEDGAVATQNMALAAYSVGVHSYWIGVHNFQNQQKSAEPHIRKLLDIPETYRVITLLPMGYSRFDIPKKERKPQQELIFKNKFGQR